MLDGFRRPYADVRRQLFQVAGFFSEGHTPSSRAPLVADGVIFLVRDAKFIPVCVFFSWCLFVAGGGWWDAGGWRMRVAVRVVCVW